MEKKKGKSKVKRKPMPRKVYEAASEAMQGNKWWNLRSKHGRDKLFATPQLMWEAAVEYFEYVDSHPEYMVKPMVTSQGAGEGSQVEMVHVPVRQPYTMHGLCLYLDCSTGYFRAFKATSKDKDFLAIIAKIEEAIYKQKFDGAASGFFNTNIIARDLGLIDRHDVKSGDEPIQAPVIKVYNEAPPLADNEESVDSKKEK